MIRLLVQYIDDNPFGGDLHEFGIFKTFNEAVIASLPLLDDNKIYAILANDGLQWVRLK